MTNNEPDLEFREGEYGEKVLAVEPGGIEAIPDGDRHGKARDMFAVWVSPNLEFATIYVGALGVLFGLSFVQAVLGILLGNGLGALAHYFLTQDGPRYGVPQMVVGRSAFGKFGNIPPALTNWFAAGIGWFAVNSASGAFALSTLAHMSGVVALVIVVVIQITVAFIGHNLVQKVERYLMPYLVIVFGVAAVIALSKSHPSAPSHWYFPGAFLVFLGAVYGYAAGWNPFASDYSRYLPKSENRKFAGLSAALGLFGSAAILEIVGAGAATAGLKAYGPGTNPVGDFTNLLPGWLGKLVLLGIVLGSICANALNIYSGSMSCLTLGIRAHKLPLRGIFAIVFGVAGFFVAHWSMSSPGNNFENFLLIMSYWIGPWLGVIFADKILRKGASVEHYLFRNHENYVAPVAFIVATAASIYFFANNPWFTGYAAKHNGDLGDLAFPVGFAISFVIYMIGSAGRVKKEVAAQQ